MNRWTLAGALWLAGAAGTVPAAPGAVPPPVEQARADCARPQFASDRLICSDDELRAADAEIAAPAARPPSLVADALWEAQPAWIRRRSRCAFETDHRACLHAAYADRRAVLEAAASGQTPRPLRCGGRWAGRALTIGDATGARTISDAADARLVAVASRPGARWQPQLGWQPTARGVRLRPLDGQPFDCLVGPPPRR